MFRRVIVAIGALGCLGLFTLPLTVPLGAQQARNPDRWEPAMKAFEEEARTSPPPAGEIVFYGSSTIRMWDLAASFPGLKTINRGFGGAEMSDLPRYLRSFAERSKNIVFIDVETIVLGKDGKPRGDLFREDGVHLTPEGYKLYTAVLRRHLS